MNSSPEKKKPMFTLGGLAASRGFVSGPVFLFTGGRELAVPEYSIHPEDAIAELARFHAARAETKRQLLEIVDDFNRRAPGSSEADVFTNHLQMVDDQTIITECTKRISENLVNAECAVHRTVEKYRELFSQMDDPYLRERVRDIEDIGQRMLRAFAGKEAAQFPKLSEPAIVIADDLTPSDTVALPRDLVLGFATDRGSVTSHVSLLARSLGIPAVVGLGDASMRLQAGDRVLLDGTNGALTVNPDEATCREFSNIVERERELRAMLDDGRDLPCAMKCGHRIRLSANAHPGIPVQTLKGFGAEGVGLYRSEYLWLGSGEQPSEEVQFKAYSDIVSGFGENEPVAIRVLDIGGDKQVEGMSAYEENPFLGNRSIRYLLSHRDVLRAQLRAILRASALGPAEVMYPMVATVEELKAANAELEGEKARLRLARIPFNENIRCGAMIEVPSAALNSAALAREVDFFSMGTNDLVQYTMAADRGNDEVAYLYQPTNPAVLRLVDMTVASANAAGIPVAVCGETASDPVLALLWVGMGIKELSMSASYLPVIKKVLREMTFADAKALADEVRARLDTDSAAAIYSRCREYLLAKEPAFAEIQSYFMHDGPEL